MRVLFVHPHDVCSSLEPWTIRILQLAANLRRMGHEATLAYFPRTDNAGPRPRSWQDVPLVELDRRTGPVSFLRNTLQLIRLAGRTDILHLQKCFHWAAVPALIAGSIRRKPIHYDWDDWEEKIYLESAKPPSGGIAGWLRLLERWIPQLAGTVTVASERLRQEAISLGVPESRIGWVPVGADPEVFHPGVDAEIPRRKWGLNGKTVLYLGQLHGGQYVDLLLEAAFFVGQEIPDARFLIVGEGYQRSKLQEKAKQWGLPNVQFCGGVPHQEIPSYIAGADVCVAPFEETEVTLCKSPLKIAEYLAGGKAIVASRVGEVGRMIEEAGVLVPPGNAMELARGIVVLLQSPEKRERLGQLARQRSLQHLSWRHSAERLFEAYQTLTGSP
ncbi:MAG: glycosyltransferase family 4 protein [Candidatus Omnitrophica bacterium]|nr:glycosyltransferase family 4 protein [Candidatus Omnitrophota bacterium]